MSELEELKQACLTAFHELDGYREMSEVKEVRIKYQREMNCFARVVVWIEDLQKYGRILNQLEQQKLARGESVRRG